MAISRYSGNGVEQTLEQYVPLPFQEMMQAGQAIQQRGDLAEQQRDQVDTGLSSIETVVSGQTDFKNKFVNDYRKEGAELLKKYPNPSDPDFIRESRKLNMKFANDPRLQIIKQTNELYKQRQQLEAQKKAKGELFISPKFTGVDENGNLNSNVSPLEAVNTLQDWEESSKLAWQSMEDDGRGNKSNQGNLNRNKIQQLSAFANNTPEAQRLIRAYQDTYGMNTADATKAAITSVQSNLNKYGIKSDKSFEAERMQLARDEAAQRKIEFNARMADREEARREKAAKAGKPDEPEYRPRIELRSDKDLNSVTGKGKALVTSSSTAYNPAKGTLQSLNLSNALILNQDGKSTKGPTGNTNAINKGAVTVLVDKTGKVYNSQGGGSLSSDRSSITYTDKTGKKNIVQLKPIAAIEYYDPRTKNLIYQPLTKEQALVAGFDYNQTVDFKPASTINTINNKVEFNYNDLNRINKILDSKIATNPNLLQAKTNFNNVYVAVKNNNVKGNLKPEEVRKLVDYMNDIQNQVYNDLYRTDLQQDFNNTSTAGKQAGANVADEKFSPYIKTQLDKP